MQQKLDQRVKTVDRLGASLQELQQHLQSDSLKLDGLQERLNERESRCEQLERKMSMLHQEKNDLMNRTGDYPQPLILAKFYLYIYPTPILLVTISALI